MSLLIKVDELSYPWPLRWWSLFWRGTKNRKGETKIYNFFKTFFTANDLFLLFVILFTCFCYFVRVRYMYKDRQTNKGRDKEKDGQRYLQTADKDNITTCRLNLPTWFFTCCLFSLGMDYCLNTEFPGWGQVYNGSQGHRTGSSQNHTITTQFSSFSSSTVQSYKIQIVLIK